MMRGIHPRMPHALNRKQHIFVVDDDASMSRAIARLLAVAGLQAHTFSSAEALLESHSAAEADCFLFDVDLPGLSGFGLRDRLRELGISRPVFYISAFDETERRERAQETAATGYFPKPFNGRRLLAAIQQVTRHDDG